MEWSEIQGWFDFDRLYREAVDEAADGAHFVEVGSWLGRSTVYLAEQIARSGKRIALDAVDSWDGGSRDPANARLREELAKQTEPLYEHFLRNLDQCGVKGRVRPVRCDSARAAADYLDGSLDLVFIDGDHAQPKVTADLEAFWPKVRLGGKLAGHDIGETSVEAAVEGFCRQRGLTYYREGASWIIEKFTVPPANILLGIPHAGRIFPATAMSAMIHPAAGAEVNVEVTTHQTSLLASGFNFLWSTALEKGYTHFAMLHADVVPEWFWLNMLLSELQRTGADLVSVVVPIKDSRGLTSTGIGHPSVWWSPLRRLTVKEVVALPATFDAADAGYPDHALLINTGCWLADLRNPKWRETDSEGLLKTYFTICDRIARNEDGKLRCRTQSEDWFFSTKMFQNGLKAVATRKVQLGHYADFPWPNHGGWGVWQHDNETMPHWGNGQSKAKMVPQCQASGEIA